MKKIIIEVPFRGSAEGLIIEPDETTDNGNAVYRLEKHADSAVVAAVGALIYQREIERNPLSGEIGMISPDSDPDLFTTID